jgi:hypothetical protein
MSFKLTIEVPDNKLISTLRQLTGHKVTVEGFGITGAIPPGTLKKANGDARSHGRADSRLTMTGKVAQKGSQIEKAVELFEKLEKRKGIGVVTVQDFRDLLVKKELPKALAQRCVTEKFMSYL